MDTRRFLERVQAEGRLASAAEAERVSGQVLRTLGAVLGGGELAALRAELPPELARWLADAADEPDGLHDRQSFVGPLVAELDTEYLYDQTLGGLDLVSAYADDDASRRVRAVFTALREGLTPATLQAVERALPEEIADWFRSA